MPLRRIDCADPALKREGRRVLLPLKSCLDCAATRNNGCAYTYEILKSMFGAEQDRGRNISTTAILGKCIRQTVLARKVPYAESPDDMWARYKGTMAHAILEGNMAPGCWGEVRVWARVPTLDGEWISCMPDLVDPAKGILFDYKTAKELPKYGNPWPDHEAQLQVNRWIIDNAVGIGDTQPTEGGNISPEGHVFEFEDSGLQRPEEWTALCITYITDKTTATYEVTKSIDVPNKTNDGTHKQRVIDIWSDEEVLDFMVPRIEELRLGLDNYPDYVPSVPDDIEWLGKGFPCGFCSVREECRRLVMEEGR